MNAAITSRVLSGILAICGAAATAGAHVELDAPNGGEELEVGSTFTVTWHIVIPHNLQNWDLWYSTASSSGPWTTIEADLPAGDPSGGSTHTYDWTIPDDVDEDVWVRVRMDNQFTDYEDVSNAPFAIVAPQTCSADCATQDGNVNIEDLLALLNQWGETDTSCDLAPKGGDGIVDVNDLLALLNAWGTCP